MDLEGQTVIYGGSFNPPHMGHQMALLYLLEGLGADTIWLLPTDKHPFGKNLTHFDHRCAMCKLLAKPFGERVVVQNLEKTVGDGHTITIVEHLQKQYPSRRFALAVGADILKETHAWHRWQDIVERVLIVVLGREGYKELEQTPLTLPAISSSEVRQRILASRSLAGLVPKTIITYISEHQLYRGM
ncbi:MAG: nicotinate (nicotinamide) nucleotide adenylyltransferase [Myxococcota bacterium]